MDIKSALLASHDKETSDSIIEWIGHDSKKMRKLMDVFFHEDYKLSQRSAMTVGDMGRRKPSMVEPYYRELVENLERPRHDAVVRNTLRIFSEVLVIPEELEGILYEKCFNYLTSKDSPLAVKVFGMTVLARLANKFPDLKEELVLTIEDLIPHNTVGFKMRAQKLLPGLKKQ